MSSFSSVIRKPGGRIAPKVAPKRVVRKAFQVSAQQQQSQSASQLPSESAAGSSADQPIWFVEDETARLVDGDRLSATISKVVEQVRNDANVNATRSPEPPSDQHALANAIPAVQDLLSEGQELTASEVQAADALLSINKQAAATPRIEAVAVEKPNQSQGKSKPARNEPRTSRSTPSKEHSLSRQAAVPTQAGETANDQNDEAPQPAMYGPQHVSSSPKTARSKNQKKQRVRSSASTAKSLTPRLSLPTPPTTQASKTPDRPCAASNVPQRDSSVASQRSQTENAMYSIADQLLKIRDISAAIEAGTTYSQSRSRSRQSATRAATTACEETADETATEGRPRKRRKRNNATSQTIQTQAAQVVANAIGDDEPAPIRGRRRRRITDEQAHHEIEPQTTMMGDILDDRHRWGKVSEIEKQMQANWPEILKRRREAAELRLIAAREGRHRNKITNGDARPDGARNTQDEQEIQGPEMEMVIENGQIVVASREIDRSKGTQNVVDSTDVALVREDLDIYKRVNSGTLASRQQIAPGQQWDDQSTELLYQGLKMFGTDFKMISNMIPGKNRRQVKLKYNAEERVNWPKIQRYLNQKEEVKLDEYAQMTGLTMVTVADVYKQMDEEEKRLRAEDEARRREEGIISQDRPDAENADGEADIAMPSIESEGEATAAANRSVQVAPGDRQSTAAASRLGSTTTGRQTAQPSGKKKPTKKSASAATGKRGRQAANRNKGFEGVEERLGDVGDIGIPAG